MSLRKHSASALVHITDYRPVEISSPPLSKFLRPACENLLATSPFPSSKSSQFGNQNIYSLSRCTSTSSILLKSTKHTTIKCVASSCYAASFFTAALLWAIILLIKQDQSPSLLFTFAQKKIKNQILSPHHQETDNIISQSPIQKSIVLLHWPLTIHMAPLFHLPYFHSTPNLPQHRNFTPPPPPTTPTLTPGPLRIFKRSSRNASPNVLPLSTLGVPPAEGSAASTGSSSSDHSYIPNPPPPSSSSPSHDTSISTFSPSTYHSALSLPITASLTAPSSPTFINSNNNNNASLPPCSLCLNPLPKLQTYSFPQTAPAVTEKVRKLFPRMNESPVFCGTCFEAIHAVFLCWGCGNPVHREEERVGCGWAWWHWGCVRCLICRVCVLMGFLSSNQNF